MASKDPKKILLISTKKGNCLHSFAVSGALTIYPTIFKATFNSQFFQSFFYIYFDHKAFSRSRNIRKLSLTFYTCLSDGKQLFELLQSK